MFDMLQVLVNVVVISVKRGSMAQPHSLRSVAINQSDATDLDLPEVGATQGDTNMYHICREVTVSDTNQGREYTQVRGQ